MWSLSVSDKPHQRARLAGAVLQGMILGLLTFIALCNLAQESSADQVFRYQGF